jgi:hypothetical protein
MAEPHDWHTLDAVRGIDVRQLTDEGDENRWQVRYPDGSTQILDDAAFDRLRGGGE